LNAIVLPSGDQAPRLSSRVVAITSCAAPAGFPVTGDTGSFQTSAFCLRIENAIDRPSDEIAAETSWPAPAVTCCGTPIGAPSLDTGMLQMLIPPPRSEEK